MHDGNREWKDCGAVVNARDGDNSRRWRICSLVKKGFAVWSRKVGHLQDGDVLKLRCSVLEVTRFTLSFDGARLRFLACSNALYFISMWVLGIR